MTILLTLCSIPENNACEKATVDEVAKLGAFWRVYDWPQDKMAREGLKFLRNILS